MMCIYNFLGTISIPKFADLGCQILNLEIQNGIKIYLPITVHAPGDDVIP